MNGIRVIEEIERVMGTSLKDTEGLVNIDFSVYFPYANQDIISAEVTLSDDIMPDNSAIVFKTEGYVLNHRYPNTSYVTMSKKQGRKTCKTGYFFTASRETLNKLRYMSIRVGAEDEIVTYIVPLEVDLSEEQSYTSSSIRVSMKEPETPVLSITVHKPAKPGCWKEVNYCQSRETYDRCKEWWGEENTYMLNGELKPAAELNADEKFNYDVNLLEQVMHCGQTVNLLACKRNELLI